MDLAAQDEALGADGRVTGTLADDRVAGAGDKPGDLVAALAAEAASLLGHRGRDGLQRAKRGLSGLARADDRLGSADTFVADVPTAAQSTRVYSDFVAAVGKTQTRDTEYCAVSIVGPRNPVDKIVGKIVGKLPLMP